MSDQPESYRGARLAIHFDGRRCIHSRNCVLGRPEVFQANVEGPWIAPDHAPVDDVVAAAQACPSGAITYERLDGGPQESAPPVNVIRVRENGPLAVHAAIALAGEAPRLRATLCRCGASGQKPYCDGSHVGAGFQATGEPATRASEPLGERGGALTITPAPNGPLILNGNVEVCSGTGRTVDRVRKVALCRCGSSGNKPYCDGSHARAGFQS